MPPSPHLITFVNVRRSDDAFVAAFSPGSVLDDPARIADVAPIKYQFISAGGPLPEGDALPIYEFVSAEEAREARNTNGRGNGGGSRKSFDGQGWQWEGDAEQKEEGLGEDMVTQSLRFRLLNLRDEEGYRFGLFTGGLSHPVLVAKTEEAVVFARPYEVSDAY